MVVTVAVSSRKWTGRTNQKFNKRKKRIALESEKGRQILEAMNWKRGEGENILG